MRAPTLVGCALAVLVGASAPAAAAPVPWIDASAIADTVIAALAAADPATAALGAGVQVAYVNGPIDVEATRAALAARFTAAGLTVVAPGPATGELTEVLEDGRGARVVIALSADRGSVVIVPRPAHPRLRGPCVVPPAVTWTTDVHAAGIDQEGERHASVQPWRLTTGPVVDVDGDAIPDVFVPRHRAGQCPEEGRWDVYVMRGACGHLLGSVGPGWIAADSALVAVDRSGFRPLAFESEHASYGSDHLPSLVTTVTRYRVVGGRYRRQSSRASGGVCHHCAVWWCAPS